VTRRKQLLARKALLLQEIEQQRLDLSHSTVQWLDRTAQLDHYWQQFMKIRKVAFLGAGIVILFSLKKPSKALKLSRMTVKFWGVTRLAQRLLLTDKKS
jgi:hypothetical protein